MCLKPTATPERDTSSRQENPNENASQTSFKAKVRVLCNSTMLEERRNGIRKHSLSSRSSCQSLRVEDEQNYSSFSSVTSDIIKNGNYNCPDLVEDDWANVNFFIQYWNLSEQESAKFLELRDRVSDVTHRLNRPGSIIRYMRSKGFDVDRSEHMIRETVAWRHENKVDSILQDYCPPQEIIDHYPGAILKGTDRNGDPIFVSRTGETDLYGLVDKYGEQEMIRYEIYRREAAIEGTWVREWEKASGRPIQRTFVIEDLKGLNTRHLAKRVLKFYGLACDLDAKYYPEMNKKIVIIRTPSLFRFVWAIVKHFFDPIVVEKMEFCGENYHHVLEKYLDLNVLPPCIYPDGIGAAVDGLPPRFEGGNLIK